MKKVLLFVFCLVLVGCASSKEEITIKNTVIPENEILKSQEKYEFDTCVGISEGDISRCENFETVCYIAHNPLTDNNSISCFKK